MGVAKGWHKNFEDGINQGGINIIEFLVGGIKKDECLMYMILTL